MEEFLTSPARPRGKRVASVGSPSTNSEVTLDLNADGRQAPLVGALLTLENKMGQGSELALGTVTEVTTRNRWHEDAAFRGAAAADGQIQGLSGDGGDTRTATIRLQAAWRRDTEESPWLPSGPSLRMSPGTGSPVTVVDNALIESLTETVKDLHFIGHIAGTGDVRLPLTMPDFSGPLGATHSVVCGSTGAGKSQAALYMLAAQMRHDQLGMIVVDPQGQWASETGMVFSLQGFAAELGREVAVRRISTDLRLAKDVKLLLDMVQHTQLPKELGLKSAETAEYVWYEVTKCISKYPDWENADSADLLRAMLTHLTNDTVAGRIYTSNDRRALFLDRIQTLLDDPTGFDNALRQFAPIHNLFSTHNPNGGERHSLWASIARVFERSTSGPAPLLILDMSSAPPPGMDEVVDEATEAANTILELDVVKAAILRNLFGTLKRASEAKFRQGISLNTLVVLDEAWRYAAPPAKVEEPEMAALSKDLAGYARDTRKFGIGWLYITQATRSINPDIWDQLSVRLFGYGLAGADVDKMAEIVDDRDSLRLYKAFAPPRSTGRYPFLLTGPVSPLAVTRAPIAVDVYTHFEEFRADNAHWIAPIRARLGLPVLSGLPVAPGAPGAPKQPAKAPRARSNQSRVSQSDARAQIIETSAAARANRATVGLQDAAGFADPLNGIDDAPF